MPEFFGLANGLGSSLLPILTTIAIILILYIVFSFFLGLLKKNLLKLAKSKKQVSNVEIFSTALRYIFLFLLLLAAVFSYSGSFEGLAITFGLLSAAVGFALQKPISGVAAWMMIVTRRPFEIGDRIIIGDVKGDVKDISLTHITLREIGGIVPSEENSGRRILVPNSLLFEQNIVNYTQQDEFILGQVVFSVTYKSNLEKAIKIGRQAAAKQTKRFAESVKEQPYVRAFFQPSGISLSVRFFVPAKKLTQFSSEVTKEVFERVAKTKGVKFAYPHTEVLLSKGKAQG